MTIASINPVTGETFRTFKPLAERELDCKLAAKTFRAYRRTSFAERAKMMTHAAEIFETGKDKFARIMTMEMEKPLKAAGGEAVKCATACRYYAETAERALASEVIATNATRSYVQYQPLGFVLAVMPWNFPFWL
jgi:succinate-semialdehyde dehydrogenase / glutarate-semialdehyde dehydrogenase